MPRSSLLSLASLALLALSQSVQAHPHVFVDTTIDLGFTPDGLMDTIKVTWTYDDLYSLMILEDNNLDSDGDGKLTQAEVAALQGFDSHWPADFPGNTYILLRDEPLELGRPFDWTASFENGKLTSTHVQHLAKPVRPDATPLVIKNYDPEHYYAYTIIGATLADPAKGCSSQVIPYDPVAADEAMSADLNKLMTLMANEPASTAHPTKSIGEYYSDKVEVTCSQR